MALVRNGIENKKYLLPGAFKKNGFGTYRFFFTGFERITNVARRFFLEVEQINPSLSPLEPSFGAAGHIKFSEEDLQYALAGTESAKSVITEQAIQPSYVVVRVGIFGRGAKQLCKYHASKAVKILAKPFVVEAEDCKFDKETLFGKITCRKEDEILHPEFFCNGGTASWDLSYEIKSDSGRFVHDMKFQKWFPCGMHTEFSGVIIFDNIEYIVSPEKSSGYIDVCAGKSLPIPLVHLSSSNLTSAITGGKLFESSFAVHGEYDGKISVFVKYEKTDLSFLAGKSRKNFMNRWDCVIMPQDGEDEKVHWTMSVSDKHWIVDVDVYCRLTELFVREFELPEGNKKTLKVLCGGSGNGNVRIFKQLKKGIELIEEAHAESILCEYGAADNS